MLHYYKTIMKGPLLCCKEWIWHWEWSLQNGRTVPLLKIECKQICAPSALKKISHSEILRVLNESCPVKTKQPQETNSPHTIIRWWVSLNHLAAHITPLFLSLSTFSSTFNIKITWNYSINKRKVQTLQNETNPIYGEVIYGEDSEMKGGEESEKNGS